MLDKKINIKKIKTVDEPLNINISDELNETMF